MSPKKLFDDENNVINRNKEKINSKVDQASKSIKINQVQSFSKNSDNNKSRLSQKENKPKFNLNTKFKGMSLESKLRNSGQKNNSFNKDCNFNNKMLIRKHLSSRFNNTLNQSAVDIPIQWNLDHEDQIENKLLDLNFVKIQEQTQEQNGDTDLNLIDN